MMNASRREHDGVADAIIPVLWTVLAVSAGLTIALSMTIGLSPSTLIALLFWIFLA